MMANEPIIEFKGHVGRIVDFRNGGCMVSVSVTPSYKDKNSGDWVDKETLWFDVRPLSNDAKDAVDQIRQYKQRDLSVRVLVSGGLSKGVSEKDGVKYEHLEVGARTLAVLSAKPKRGATANGTLPPQQGFSNGNPFGGAQPAQGGQQYPPQQPADPWGQDTGWDDGTAF
ncbi:single stranded DNA-binding domain-containing protein [Bifidobacterium platyrrhinorum]|uniref:Single-stranded DNA-binding protein n=1 Tax=Bifidobacterium platyrrhinorum TaxID=2661628 RepID=A0A6L9SV45_9BIFI|nr:hypothetical protein [Bifidobacterium platyrrhinorum]NEG55412.1 hypothetical protein [Bifidobacterium platyrrhinorum]